MWRTAKAASANRSPRVTRKLRRIDRILDIPDSEDHIGE
jgi:hypothetical protein